MLSIHLDVQHANRPREVASCPDPVEARAAPDSRRCQALSVGAEPQTEPQNREGEL